MDDTNEAVATVIPWDRADTYGILIDYGCGSWRSYFVGSHEEAQQERARMTLMFARRRAARKGGYISIDKLAGIKTSTTLTVVRQSLLLSARSTLSNSAAPRRQSLTRHLSPHGDPIANPAS
jgi:hypothetical protein